MELIAAFLAPRRETRRIDSSSTHLEIGRENSAGLCLDHPSVSRRHARLTLLEGNSHFLVEDCGSANGTFVEGVPVRDRTAVHYDQVVEIGPFRFRICQLPGGNPKRDGSPPVETADEERILQQAVESLPSLMGEDAKGQDGRDSDLASQAEKVLYAKILGMLPPRTDPEKVHRLTRRAITFAMGLGPLEEWLRDPSVTEIMINGVKALYLERSGRLLRHPAVFPDEAALMRIVERVLSPLGRRVDDSVPYADGRLPDGSRINVVIPPISLDGPVVTIRKFADRRLDMKRLVDLGTLSQEAADFLSAAVTRRRNILVSGGTGSGKTTLLNTLASCIPHGERIVTIEDAAELKLHQEHVVRLETRPPNVEGRGEVATRDLVRNCLRMRPDRIIVGECRGGETLDMLQAMNTGHEGSMTTCHANSPRDALRRLETMALMAGVDLPHRVVREQVASAIHIIVQIVRRQDGARAVQSIVEVDGSEGDQIMTQPLFECRQHNGRRRLASSGLLSRHVSSAGGKNPADGVTPHN